MIQTIKEARTGTKFVCELPPGWNAILFRGLVLMVHEACAPVVLETDARGVWVQRNISLAPPPPQK